MSSPAPYACCNQERSVKKLSMVIGYIPGHQSLDQGWKAPVPKIMPPTPPTLPLHPILGHSGAEEKCCISTTITTSMSSLCCLTPSAPLGVRCIHTRMLLSPITHLHQATVTGNSQQVENFPLLASTEVL